MKPPFVRICFAFSNHLNQIQVGSVPKKASNPMFENTPTFGRKKKLAEVGTARLS